jgi:hypothetical protein
VHRSEAAKVDPPRKAQRFRRVLEMPQQIPSFKKPPLPGAEDQVIRFPGIGTALSTQNCAENGSVVWLLLVITVDDQKDDSEPGTRFQSEPGRG